jgi:hypothetical protein
VKDENDWVSLDAGYVFLLRDDGNYATLASNGKVLPTCIMAFALIEMINSITTAGCGFRGMRAARRW